MRDAMDCVAAPATTMRQEATLILPDRETSHTIPLGPYLIGFVHASSRVAAWRSIIMA